MDTTLLTWPNVLIMVAISIGLTLGIFVLLVVRDRYLSR
jgi:hypothetical protein